MEKDMNGIGFHICFALGLAVGNFFGGWLIHEDIHAGIAQAIIVIPVYAVLATIAGWL